MGRSIGSSGRPRSPAPHGRRGPLPRADGASAVLEVPRGRADSDLSAGVLDELGGEAADMAGLSASMPLRRGEVWWVTPRSDAALVAVEQGFVVISADTRNATDHSARRVVVATGQQGMLLPSPEPDERLEALTPSRISVVSGDGLKVLLALPSVAEAIADAFAEAIRDRQATIRNCVHVRHSERVLAKLLQLARTYGRAVPGGVRVDFPLTHQLLADMVGSARETVSLALSDLARRGLVHCQHRRFVLRMAPHELFSTLPVPDVAPERQPGVTRLHSRATLIGSRGGL